jgi:hypothetical protein
MKIMKFPTQLPAPAPGQLAVPDISRTTLSELAHMNAKDILNCANSLLAADMVAEFATLVHETADTLAVMSAGWAKISRTIRQQWFKK